MGYKITVLPHNVIVEGKRGECLSRVLARAGFPLDTPCGGVGTCGKCLVTMDGVQVKACQTPVTGDGVVQLPEAAKASILAEGMGFASDFRGACLAFDLGTTTVVGYFIKDGKLLATESLLNSQAPFGADVVSRIRHALGGKQADLTEAARRDLSALTDALCRKAGVAPWEILQVGIVGNPAMEQLLLGICPENLSTPPFRPVITETLTLDAKTVIPALTGAKLRIAPNISGFVGGDTIGCLLATRCFEGEEYTLLVDIGTNGEMVMGNRHRLVACSTAAGPALEGGNISCGMRGQTGAIDHVWAENGMLRSSVIGGGDAVGICGSGLIDAVATALELGLLNKRGRILNEKRCLRISERVCLTQEDVRNLQSAKGAIAAGIRMMAEFLDINLSAISKVYLAGAFGTYMNPESACRIGLLPRQVQGKTIAAGNAAGMGACLLACREEAVRAADDYAKNIEHPELGSLPGFARCFARSMELSDGTLD